MCFSIKSPRCSFMHEFNMFAGGTTALLIYIRSRKVLCITIPIDIGAGGTFRSPYPGQDHRRNISSYSQVDHSITFDSKSILHPLILNIPPVAEFPTKTSADNYFLNLTIASIHSFGDQKGVNLLGY